MAIADPDLIKNTKEAIEKIQNFNPSSLIREEELGKTLCFSGAVEPATNIINLFKQISIELINILPDEQLNVILNEANRNFQKFQNILEFKTDIANPAAIKNSFIGEVKTFYSQTFKKMFPLISYSICITANLDSLQQDAIEITNQIRTAGKISTNEMDKIKEESLSILNNIRDISAEKGVSQQAIHFKEQFDYHEDKANYWKKLTFWFTGILGLYSLGSFFIHKIPWFTTDNTYNTVQLAISKVLIFGVISYLLYLAARNFIANKHNAIINKHRQTALLTFIALMNAAESIENKEIILTHASACIFSPQPTGFSKESSSSPTAKSVIELLAKPFSSVPD